MATTKKKRAVKKKTAEPKFGNKDKVLVTYQTKYYDIDHVPGIIVRANKKKGFQFQVRMQDDNGDPINKGHDQNKGEPGSGPYIFVDAENLELVEKYVPKRCAGDVKTTWRIGETFIPKEDFSEDQDDSDDITGVSPEMVAQKGTEMTVVGIMTRFGPTVLIDNTINHGWLPEWIDPVE